MKEEALQLIRNVSDPALKLNRLREYLQALVLRSLHECEAFVCVAFVGGTALRFVFGLPRFSEDLDFSLERSAGYSPQPWMRKVKQDLVSAGFDASVSWSEKGVVHKGWVKLSGLLKESSLAAMAEQKLSIKLEIDTRPPAGASSVRTLITNHRLLAIRHYDLPSLMAGKVHALCARSYPKGRDWYDLLWYLGQRPPVTPNLLLLQNALDQTQGCGAVHSERWRDLLRERAEGVDFRLLQADVRPFLERPAEAELLTRENVRSLL